MQSGEDLGWWSPTDSVDLRVAPWSEELASAVTVTEATMAYPPRTLVPWMPEEGELWFSNRFNVDPATLKEYGAYDISVVTDTPLFVDPFLLFNSENDKYQALHQQMLDYLRFLKAKAPLPLPKGLVQNWFAFHEVKQNWLGFTEDGNAGHGLGAGFARDLRGAFQNLLRDFGRETITDSSHLEKLALLSDRVGRDTISDFTTNLIKHYLCTYTEEFARQHLEPALCDTFAVTKAVFNFKTESWVTRQYVLPRLGHDYVLLTPIDMLTRDDTWINRPEMLARFDVLPEALPDAETRARVAHYLANQLGTDPMPKEVLAARAKTIRAFPELADYYIAIKEDDGDRAREVSLAKAEDMQALLRDQVRLAIRDIQAKTDLFTQPWTSYEEALEAVETFKYYVENQDGYTVINRGEGQPFATEREVQSFFGLLLQRSNFDANREVNNGRGAVDFKLSMGAADKSLIEFKLAKSSSLKRNVMNQLSVYEKANKTNKSVMVVIAYTEADMNKVDRVLREVGSIPAGVSRSIVVIDARADNKPSASTV